MKSKIYLYLGILLPILFFLFVPVSIFAHGGVEKSTNDITVQLYQDPLSPLVGEKINFTFLIRDKAVQTPIANKQVRLELIETVTGDASKDKVVYKKDAITDTNGVIKFAYTFEKINYYDLELQFGSGSDEQHAVGFLVQPRSLVKGNNQIIVLAFSILLNFTFVGYILLRKYFFR